MKNPTHKGDPRAAEHDDVNEIAGEQPKQRYAKPKLTYVKPKIERHAIPDVTAGFFGTFYA